jgi:hypothetical protein
MNKQLSAQARIPPEFPLKSLRISVYNLFINKL